MNRDNLKAKRSLVIAQIASLQAQLAELERLDFEFEPDSERILEHRSLLPTVGFRTNRQGEFLDIRASQDETMIVSHNVEVGQTLSDVLPKDIARQILIYVDHALNIGHIVGFEYQIKSGNGELHSHEVRVTPINAGEVLIVLCDVTEQQQVLNALRESEARISSMLKTTVDAIITIDEFGHIESFNQAAEQIFGYEPREVVGENIKMLMPSPYREEHDAYITSYLETGHKKIIGIGREVIGRRKDGTVFPMDLAVSEVQLNGRKIFTGVIRDITARRQLEQEILRITEQERRRIGQDLHDGLGQMLTGIGLIAQNLTRNLKAENSAHGNEAEEITELIRQADQQARGLARGLVPVDLEADGIVSAMKRLCANAGRLFQVDCSFEAIGSTPLHDLTSSFHLYRIAQEAVSNAVKHGKADQVRVTLALGEDRLRLLVHDNGIGFPDVLPEEQGMGVRIMHYRARIIGAVLDIRAGVEGGTTVSCTLNRKEILASRHRKQPGY